MFVSALPLTFGGCSYRRLCRYAATVLKNTVKAVAWIKNFLLRQSRKNHLWCWRFKVFKPMTTSNIYHICMPYETAFEVWIKNYPSFPPTYVFWRLLWKYWCLTLELLDKKEPKFRIYPRISRNTISRQEALETQDFANKRLSRFFNILRNRTGFKTQESK